MKRALLLVVFAAAFGASLSANPFLSGSGPGIDVGPRGGPIRSALAAAQGELNQKLAALAVQAREDPTAGPVLLALAVAVLYGALHALGPGHGKTFVLGYFLADRPRVGRGLLLAVLISVLDSVSALAIVGGAYAVLRIAAPTRATAEVSGLLRLASAVLVTAIGLWHLVSHLRGRHSHGAPGTEPGCRPAGCADGEATPSGERAERRRMLALAVSIGLVPCPIEVVVLVFGLSIGAFGFGVVLALFLSVGAILALGVVAAAAMALRSTVMAVAGAAAHARATRALEVAGAVLILLLGLVMLGGAVELPGARPS